LKDEISRVNAAGTKEGPGTAMPQKGKLKEGESGNAISKGGLERTKRKHEIPTVKKPPLKGGGKMKPVKITEDR